MRYAFVTIEEMFVGGREGVDEAVDEGGGGWRWGGGCGCGCGCGDDVSVAARVDDPGPVAEDAESEVAGCGTAGTHLD